MSDVIRLLPDSVANQIAAGEVIQRPASVVKELVENAIDAQATSIQIVLKDAGRTLIQIIDNGVGMSATDARLAFERHSTSKIRKADDLFALQTMGFRGEALASIAAISQVELRTRRKEDQLGTKLCISASQCESQEPDVCPQGANFMIKNIFFNVPARRKFLKSNQVELSNIVKEFEKLALVNYNVEFTLTHNGNVMYKLMAGTFLQRITALMGRNIESQLVPLNVDTSIVRIQGFIARPENARKRNFLQYMFVNGRYMRHPYFHKAVMSSYNQLIPDDEQPNYFLRFTVDPQSIDVNIHPTKTEIKFEDEMPIWQILAAGVKEALGRFGEVPTIDFDTEGDPVIPPFENHPNFSKPDMGIDPTYNPFKQEGGAGTGASRPMHTQSPVTDWEKLYQDFERKKNQPIDDAPIDDAQPATQPTQPVQPHIIDDNTSTCLQLKGRYILSPVKSGLMIIDQHRAHVRILFDRYVKRVEQATMNSQSVLFPDIAHLTVRQDVVLQELLPEMQKMGFVIDRVGPHDWAINGVPSGLDGVDTKDMVLQLIDSVDQGGTSVKDKVVEHIALSIANSAAIPYGRTLMPEEMEAIVGDLLRLPEPNYTPDGHTVITVVPIEQIIKMF